MDTTSQNQSTRVISVRVATSEYIALLTEAESKKLCLSDLILMRLYGKATPTPSSSANEKETGLKNQVSELKKELQRAKTQREKKPVKTKSVLRAVKPEAEPKTIMLKAQVKKAPKRKATKAKAKVSVVEKSQQTKKPIAFIPLS